MEPAVSGLPISALVHASGKLPRAGSARPPASKSAQRLINDPLPNILLTSLSPHTETSLLVCSGLRRAPHWPPADRWVWVQRRLQIFLRRFKENLKRKSLTGVIAACRLPAASGCCGNGDSARGPFDFAGWPSMTRSTRSAATCCSRSTRPLGHASSTLSASAAAPRPKNAFRSLLNSSWSRSAPSLSGAAPRDDA